MYNDLSLGMAFCLGNGTAGEDADLGDGRSREHVVQDGGADEAGCSGEDEMHYDVCEIGEMCLRSRVETTVRSGGWAWISRIREIGGRS